MSKAFAIATVYFISLVYSKELLIRLLPPFFSRVFPQPVLLLGNPFSAPWNPGFPCFIFVYSVVSLVSANAALNTLVCGCLNCLCRFCNSRHSREKKMNSACDPVDQLQVGNGPVTDIGTSPIRAATTRLQNLCASLLERKPESIFGIDACLLRRDRVLPEDCCKEDPCNFPWGGELARS